MNDYILVIDSGVGGVSVLKKLIQKHPLESFIYYSDNKNSPYGNKSKKFLENNIIEILNNLFLKYNIKLVVFACNTLTATTIHKVRKTFKDMKFVGTEPPIKMVNKNEKTLVLCTKQTLKYCKLFKSYKNNRNFEFIALENIAKNLDENFFNREVIKNNLSKQIKKNDYTNVVLGCTHYYFLENEIKSVLEIGNVKFYKSINGICKRVASLLKKNTSLLQEVKVILSNPEDIVLKNTINFLIKY